METKFLIIGDLHGNKPKIHFNDFDAIIAPGDFCSDKEVRKLALLWKKANKKKKIAFEKFIEKSIGKKKFNEIEIKSLEDGRRILEYLNSFGKPVFIIPGNWDQSYNDSYEKMPKDYAKYVIKFFKFYMGKRTNPRLTYNLNNIIDCQMKIVNYRNLQFIGYGLCSGTELSNDRAEKLKFAKSYSKVIEVYNILEKMVFDLFKNCDKNKSVIFLSHNVPYKTKLDILINKKSELHEKHMGSSLARKAIIKFKPLVCVGGHMHEHFGKDKLCNTICINAGFGSEVNTLLTIKNGKIKSVKFYPKPYG